MPPALVSRTRIRAPSKGLAALALVFLPLLCLSCLEQRHGLLCPRFCLLKLEMVLMHEPKAESSVGDESHIKALIELQSLNLCSSINPVTRSDSEPFSELRSRESEVFGTPKIFIGWRIASSCSNENSASYSPLSWSPKSQRMRRNSSGHGSLYSGQMRSNSKK